MPKPRAPVASRRSIARACACAIEALEPRRLFSSQTQYHNDPASDGANLTELALGVANVNPTSFGKLYSVPMDGQVWAQPLYVPAVTITAGAHQGLHNVTYVATENDTLYALDAQTGVVLWQESFLVAEPGLANVSSVSTVSSTDVTSNDNPQIGITGTPVIDGGFLYLAAKTKQIVGAATTTPHYVYTLYKVNMASGAYSQTVIGDTTYNTSSKAYTYNSGPYVKDAAGKGAGVVTATIGGVATKVVYFNALRENEHMAVTAYQGNIYLAFASHGDNGPYHGWILGYSESSLTATAAFNIDPNGTDSGIWQGGGQIAMDPQGFMYVETGNGTFDTTLNASGFPVDGDYGDSFVKIALDPTSTQASQNINGWGLKVVDYFTPQNQAALSSADEDLGSGGPMVLPETVGSITIGSSTSKDLLIGSGKDGNLYLIDRNNMGKYNATTDHIAQEIGSALGGGGSFGTPGFYYDGANAYIYYEGKSDHLRVFSISGGFISATPGVSTDNFGLLGSTPTISANGDGNGIVWGIDGGTGTLRAYNASNVAGGAIYSTATNAARDAMGTAAKFTVPTVVDGTVFVGTAAALDAYGLLSPATTAPSGPNTLMASAVSNTQINLTWKDTAGNAVGYYVEESANSGSTWTQIATLSSTAVGYNVVGLAAGASYQFRVRAYNSIAPSQYSNTATAMTTNIASPVNYPSGFAGETGLTLNGSAKINASALEVTDGGASEAGSAFSSNAVSVLGFNTTFKFQLLTPNADGMTFTIQNAGANALGTAGGWLGYGGIGQSIAIKFDLFSNSGEGVNTTGLFVNGDTPTVPSGASPVEVSLDMTASKVNLHSGDVMQAQLTYDGATLVETLTDTVTKAVFTHNYAINIPATIGSGNAFVGFTGGTGGKTVTENIQSWTFTSVPAEPYAPTNLAVTPASGTELDLTWTEPYSSVTNYNILQLIGGTYTQIGQVSGSTLQFPSTGLNVGQSYSYEVVAGNSAGTSSPAGPVSGTTPTPPVDARNLTATNITTSGVTLNWQDLANNATGYKITRQLESDNSQYVTTLGPTATTYVDSGLISGRAYDYEVAAINLAGPSAGIDVVVETVPPAPVVSTAVSGIDETTLTWTDAGHAVDGYNIYRGTSPGAENYASTINGPALVAGLTYNDTSAVVGTTYYYTVKAVNTGGPGAASNEVSGVALPVFASETGSTLNVYLNNIAPIAMASSGGIVTVSQDGVQLPFDNPTAITVNGSATSNTLNFNGPLPTPIAFVANATTTLNINSGALNFAGAATITLGTMTIATGASAVMAPASGSESQLIMNTLSLLGTAALDIANNTVVVNYGNAPDPIADIASSITTGYNGGAWNGNGIFSSSIADVQHTLGYADNGSGTIEVQYALTGDANLDGTVNFSDLLSLSANYAATGTSWSQGDFFYNGTTNFADLLALSANYNESLNIPGAGMTAASAIGTRRA